MSKGKTKYESLTKSEISKLNKLLREKQGNLTEAHRKTGLTIFTIKRAALGAQAKIDTLKKIRVILRKKLQTISETELTQEG